MNIMKQYKDSKETKLKLQIELFTKDGKCKSPIVVNALDAQMKESVGSFSVNSEASKNS